MRLLSITAAIAALSFGASAAATPFSFSASSEVDQTESASDSAGLVDRLFQATANTFGIVFNAGDKQDEDIVLRFYQENKTCESQDDAEQKAESEPEEKKALVGPEPIYFGF